MSSRSSNADCDEDENQSEENLKVSRPSIRSKTLAVVDFGIKVSSAPPINFGEDLFIHIKFIDFIFKFDFFL